MRRGGGYANGYANEQQCSGYPRDIRVREGERGMVPVTCGSDVLCGARLVMIRMDRSLMGCTTSGPLKFVHLLSEGYARLVVQSDKQVSYWARRSFDEAV